MPALRRRGLAVAAVVLAAALPAVQDTRGQPAAGTPVALTQRLVMPGITREEPAPPEGIRSCDEKGRGLTRDPAAAALLLAAGDLPGWQATDTPAVVVYDTPELPWVLATATSPVYANAGGVQLIESSALYTSAAEARRDFTAAPARVVACAVANLNAGRANAPGAGFANASYTAIAWPPVGDQSIAGRISFDLMTPAGTARVSQYMFGVRRGAAAFQLVLTAPGEALPLPAAEVDAILAAAVARLEP